MNIPRRPIYQEIKSRDAILYKYACDYSQLHEQLASTRAQLKMQKKRCITSINMF